MKRIVAVIGGGACAAEDFNRARRVGALLAERGYVVLTGGLGGVMEAASRGAKEAGGLTIGVLPGLHREGANPYVDLPLTTGLSQARNLIVATTGRAVVAIGGGLGTLSEIAFALKHGRAVVGLGTWELAEHRVPGEGVLVVETPDEAVEAVDAVHNEAGREAVKERVHVLVTGRVQGVFFRATTREKAMELGLTGWVRNLPDGRVEAVAEGARDLLEAFVRSCREGPTFSRVDDLEVRWETYLAEFVDFRVVG